MAWARITFLGPRIASAGSITGTCNGAIARELSAAVLLVGRKGVGDAVDSYNLNRAYFASQGAARRGRWRHSHAALYSSSAILGIYNVQAASE